MQLFATVGPAALGTLGARYAGFLGNLVLGANESVAQFYALTGGTWEHLACHIAANSFNESTTVVSGINGSDGNMTITVPSASLSGTGNFEDTTHSDSVSAGDLLDYEFLPSGSTGSLTTDWVGCHYFAATETNCMIGGMPGVYVGFPYNGTNYTSLFGGGDINPGNRNATHATGAFPYGATLKDYANYLLPNDTGGTATFTLMVNDMASNLAISSGGSTGWLIDSSDTVGVLAGYTCANRIVGTGASGTSVTWNGAGLLVVAA